jgi:predicted kinase
MRNRIALRKQLDRDASDAGVEVLAHQLADHEPLSDEEMRNAISVDFDLDMDAEAVRKICAPMLKGSA